MKKYIRNKYFFKDIRSEDIISQQLKVSVILIKYLILKLIGKYSGETLIPWFSIKNSIKKYLFSRQKKNSILYLQI